MRALFFQMLHHHGYCSSLITHIQCARTRFLSFFFQHKEKKKKEQEILLKRTVTKFFVSIGGLFSLEMFPGDDITISISRSNIISFVYNALKDSAIIFIDYSLV